MEGAPPLPLPIFPTLPDMSTLQVSGCVHPDGRAAPPLPHPNLPTLVDPSTLQVSGCVRLDGRGATPNQLSRACASVPQHELLLPCLSVEECLRYSAAVRLGPVVSAQQAKQRVDEVMQVGSLERGRRWGRGGGENWRSGFHSSGPPQGRGVGPSRWGREQVGLLLFLSCLHVVPSTLAQGLVPIFRLIVFKFSQEFSLVSSVIPSCGSYPDAPCTVHPLCPQELNISHLKGDFSAVGSSQAISGGERRR